MDRECLNSSVSCYLFVTLFFYEMKLFYLKKKKRAQTYYIINLFHVCLYILFDDDVNVSWL